MEPIEARAILNFYLLSFGNTKQLRLLVTIFIIQYIGYDTSKLFLVKES